MKYIFLRKDAYVLHDEMYTLRTYVENMILVS